MAGLNNFHVINVTLSLLCFRLNQANKLFTIAKDNFLANFFTGLFVMKHFMPHNAVILVRPVFITY